MAELLASRPPRRFSLVIYLLFVFGLSWPFQIASSLYGRGLYAVFTLNATSMLMVTVGTFLAGWLVFRDGFTDAGWRWGTVRQHAAVLGLVLVEWIVPTLLAVAGGPVSLPGPLTTDRAVRLFLLLVVVFLPAFGEEFGWRGYLLPRLAERMTPRKAVLLHGVIWWAWHLPLVIGMAAKMGVKSAAALGLPTGLAVAISIGATVILGLIPVLLHAVIFAYLWMRSRSLAVVTVYHGAFDGVRDSIGTLDLYRPATGVWANAVVTVLGAVLLWKANWSGLAGGCRAKETPNGAAASD
jgi:membrane protease YdiL (CAAX protease family)